MKQIKKSNGKTMSDSIADTSRLLKHALSALTFEDVHTACNKIEQALSTILPFKNVKRFHDDDDDYDPFDF